MLYFRPKLKYMSFKPANFNQQPVSKIEAEQKQISVFNTQGKNIDHSVVESFGEEWLKFNQFTKDDIDQVGAQYFDIVREEIANKNTYALDIGCGTGRWAKYLSTRVGFVEAIDPSDAVFAANKLLKDVPNIRISKASVDNIPFEDETFDFAMSIGVLHHIPDTQQAMKDAVKKVKIGGYFFCYLYYNLDSRGPLFKVIFQISAVFRKIVCTLPSGLKKMVCDLIAIFVYMPFILLIKFLNFVGLKKLALMIPLSDYANKSFFIIRNDALDRFGTSLEQRFSRVEVITMMENSGLNNIVVSTGTPYYHAVGKRVS